MLIANAAGDSLQLTNFPLAVTLAEMARRATNRSASLVMRVRAVFLGFVVLCFYLASRANALEVPLDASGLGYTNYRFADVPWSIHVVGVSRTNGLYEVHSVHAGNAALGLDTLSDQVSLVNGAQGRPVAAINGDFYQRDRSYAGAPRGLQVENGELFSGPNSKYTVWLDVNGEVHGSSVMPYFHVVWPNGTSNAFRLNGERSFNGIELYTPAAGRSTRTSGGMELVLERGEGSSWLPLRVGKIYSAVVGEVRDSGNTKIATNTMVLSIGPGAMRRVPTLEPGARIQLLTTTLPSLRGIKTAIGGGPILVHKGKRQRVDSNGSENYEYSSMFERHPRAAVGWNDNYIYLVEVDGRQRGLSVGMTLDELSGFLVSLGCEEAMNFDGGGSATLWYDGEVRNSPCERAEREIANSLVVVRKNSTLGGSRASNGQ